MSPSSLLLSSVEGAEGAEKRSIVVYWEGEKHKLTRV